MAGDEPWLSFLGFFLGLAAGILNVYRVMQLAGNTRPRVSDRGRLSLQRRFERHGTWSWCAVLAMLWR